MDASYLYVFCRCTIVILTHAGTPCRAGFDILDIMSNLHRECGTRKNDYLCTELFELKLLFRFLCFMDEGLKVQMDLKVILFSYL